MNSDVFNMFKVHCFVIDRLQEGEKANLKIQGRNYKIQVNKWHAMVFECIAKYIWKKCWNRRLFLLGDSLLKWSNRFNDFVVIRYACRSLRVRLLLSSFTEKMAHARRNKGFYQFDENTSIRMKQLVYKIDETGNGYCNFRTLHVQYSSIFIFLSHRRDVQMI